MRTERQRGRTPKGHAVTDTATTTPAPSPLLLDAKAAAKALSISQRTLWGLTQPRGPIPAIRIGRAVRYGPSDLQAWIDEQKERNNADR